MTDSEICKDLSALLKGGAVGVRGDGGLISALADAGVAAEELCAESAAAIFADTSCDVLAEAAGRPFIVISEDAEGVRKEYGCACIAPGEWTDERLGALVAALAGEFALSAVNVDIPEWMRFLPAENSAVAELVSHTAEVCKNVKKIKDASALSLITEKTKYWSAEVTLEVNYAAAEAKVICRERDGIFFEMLSEIAGDKIDGEYTLMKYVRSASEAKKGYAKVRDALECARVNGYGIVSPAEEDLSYEQPSVVKQGSSVGIKLRASAPTYHVIRVDVSGEVCPIMGEASQSESLVKSMMSGFETNPEETWNTDVFGKSLKAMVQEGLGAKVGAIQEDTRAKLRKAMTRMVNEGKGGVICIIL